MPYGHGGAGHCVIPGVQVPKTPWDFGFLSLQVMYFHRLSSDISFVDVFSIYLEKLPSFPHHNWECRKLTISVLLSLKGKLKLSGDRGTPAFKKDTPPSAVTFVVLMAILVT